MTNDLLTLVDWSPKTQSLYFSSNHNGPSFTLK